MINTFFGNNDNVNTDRMVLAGMIEIVGGGEDYYSGSGWLVGWF